MTNQEVEVLLKSLQPQELEQTSIDELEEVMAQPIQDADLHEMETYLSALEPVALSEGQLELMESSMDLQQIEDHLKGFAPPELPLDLLQRMESAMEGWDRSEQSVVAEASAESAEEASVQKVSFFTTGVFQAAAAIAILFTIVGVTVMPKNDGGEHHADADVEDSTPADLTLDTPAGTTDHSNNIVNISNQAVVGSDEQPLRLMKVEYEEVYSVTGEDGKVYELKRPAVKYMLVPADTY